MTGFVRCLACSQQLFHTDGTHLGQSLFVGFGILAEFATYETLAVAHEPDFTTADGIDDGGGAEAFFGMGGEME